MSILTVNSLIFQSINFVYLCQFANTFWTCSDTNQSGSFSTDGIDQIRRNNTFVQCTSDHLTSFAVLVDVSGRSVSEIVLCLNSLHMQCLAMIISDIGSVSFYLFIHSEQRYLKVYSYQIISVIKTA